MVVEYKDDAPMVFETYLHRADEDTIGKRMEIFKTDPKVIRVAMAKLSYVGGNKTLLGVDGDAA